MWVLLAWLFFSHQGLRFADKATIYALCRVDTHALLHRLFKQHSQKGSIDAIVEDLILTQEEIIWGKGLSNMADAVLNRDHDDACWFTVYMTVKIPKHSVREL